MNKKYNIFAFVFSFIFLSNLTFSEEVQKWILVSTSKEIMIFLDKNSIFENTAWILRYDINGVSNNLKHSTYALQKDEVDCKSKSLKTSAFAEYDLNGNPKNHSFERLDNEFKTTFPSTVGRSEVDMICNIISKKHVIGDTAVNTNTGEKIVYDGEKFYSLTGKNPFVFNSIQEVIQFAKEYMIGAKTKKVSKNKK